MINITNLIENEDNFSKTSHISSIPIYESKLDFTPIITIAIPTYKRANLLKEAIESALNQFDVSNYDIIVVDNNPERDCETEELMSSYNNSIISYFKNTENIGMAGNWNRLFNLSKGEYVIMLHDDDLLEPYYMNTLLRVLRKLNTPDAIYFQNTKIGKVYNDPNKYRDALYSINIKPFDFLFGCVVQFFGACFNRISVIKLGGFSNTYYPSLDYEFFVRLSNLGKSYSVKGFPLVKYRILDNESMKTETLLNFLVMDNKIKNNILLNYSFIFKKITKSLFKLSDYKYLKNMSLLFSNNDTFIKEKIIENKNKISFIDIILDIVLRKTQLLHLNIRKKRIL